MSATFLAAGPNIRDNRTVARFIISMSLRRSCTSLGVRPERLDGRALKEILR
jgi:hypothetical protein